MKMGGRGESSFKSEKTRVTFTGALASAIVEWVLIFMLIVYAIFGHLITRFARYYELPIPCLLCSRVDNILGGEKAGFYWDMICPSHKMEMSSLVYCHFHEKLVDVRGMCETCLFSFATKDKSNAETYRLLVGKLGEEDLSGFDDGMLLSDDHSTKNLKHCSCCTELWNPRRQTLLQTKFSGSDAAHFDIPLYKETSEDLDSLEKEVLHVEEKSEDQFGLTELKFTFDNELDTQASDIHDSLEDAKEVQASSTIIHVREITEDQFKFTELKLTSDTESEIHDNLEEGEKNKASSTIIHVREKMDDHFGYTDLKITSDTESEIHENLEEVKEMESSSTIIHVREKTGDDFGYADLKTTSDTESEMEASSTTIHVREKTGDDFGYADLKTTSDTESEIHDILEEGVKNQESSTIIHVREKTEDEFGYADLKTTSDTESEIRDSLEEGEKNQESSTIIHIRDLKMNSDTESDIQISNIEISGELILGDLLRHLILQSITQEEPFISMSEDDTSCKNPIDLGVLAHKRFPQSSRDLAPSDIIQAQAYDSTTDVIDDTSNPALSMEMTSIELLSYTQHGDSDSPDFSKDKYEVTLQTLLSESESDKNRELESLQTSETRSEHSKAEQQTLNNNLELSDAYKLAISSRGKPSSEKLSEQLSAKNSSDLKLLLSQFSRGLNLTSTDILSPRASRIFDELKTPDSLTMKLLQKRASLERSNSRNSIDRNESSGVESLDFSTISEIEGENEHDRLKRQVEHDKRFLIALVMELEEERNASAGAANEAMAMITRLQEEKAALQMEASQELRMMEEQAEYDIDALDKLNDLVTEKEREIQNLEAELDYYRSKYPNESFSDDGGDALSDDKINSPSNELL